MSKFIINALIRKVQKEATEERTAEDILEEIIFNQIDNLTSDTNRRELTSSSVNGKSFTFTIPKGHSRESMIAYAEMALKAIQAGRTSVNSTAVGRFYR